MRRITFVRPVAPGSRAIAKVVVYAPTYRTGFKVFYDMIGELIGKTFRWECEKVKGVSGHARIISIQREGD